MLSVSVVGTDQLRNLGFKDRQCRDRRQPADRASASLQNLRSPFFGSTRVRQMNSNKKFQFYNELWITFGKSGNYPQENSAKPKFFIVDLRILFNLIIVEFGLRIAQPRDPKALGWMDPVGQEAFGRKDSTGRRPSGPRPLDREV